MPDQSLKINQISDQFILPGQVNEVKIQASDPSSNNVGLSLSIVSAPSFVSLSDNGNGTGIIRITPSPEITQGGRATVQVKNSGGLVAQTSFSIAVLDGALQSKFAEVFTERLANSIPVPSQTPTVLANEEGGGIGITGVDVGPHIVGVEGKIVIVEVNGGGGHKAPSGGSGQEMDNAAKCGEKKTFSKLATGTDSSRYYFFSRQGTRDEKVQDVAQKAEENALENAKAKAIEFGRNFRCAIGKCDQGICPLHPAVYPGEPSLTKPAKVTVDPGDYWTDISATAEAVCDVTIYCACLPI